MTDRRIIHRLLPALAATCLTVACSSVLELAGIEGTGDSTGSASGYGSLFVNGRAFATDATLFTLNGDAATEEDIEIGMQTVVRGDLLVPRADRISAQRTLLAPVDGIARVGAVKSATLSMLGQNVRVDEMTRLIGVSLDTLNSDMLIDVHAIVADDGDLLATYLGVVEPTYTPASRPLLATGHIDALSATTLTIGSLTVDLSTIAQPPTLAIDDRVVVTGIQPARGGDLLASAVMVDTRSPTAGEYADRAVLVDAVNGTQITSGSTVIDVGAAQRQDPSSSVIEAGAHLIARGPVDETGLLVAEDIEVIPAPELVLHGFATVQQGALRILDQTIVDRSTTQLLESRPAAPRQFAASDIQTGDALVIVGYQTQNGDVLATRIERRNSLDLSSIYGILGEFEGGPTSNRMVIAGVEVVTDNNTIYESVAGTQIPEVVFKATTVVGLTLQAWGVEDDTAGVLVADRVRLLNTEQDIN